MDIDRHRPAVVMPHIPTSRTAAIAAAAAAIPRSAVSTASASAAADAAAVAAAHDEESLSLVAAATAKRKVPFVQVCVYVECEYESGNSACLSLCCLVIVISFVVDRVGLRSLKLKKLVGNVSKKSYRSQRMTRVCCVAFVFVFIFLVLLTSITV